MEKTGAEGAVCSFQEKTGARPGRRADPRRSGAGSDPRSVNPRLSQPTAGQTALFSREGQTRKTAGGGPSIVRKVGGGPSIVRIHALLREFHSSHCPTAEESERSGIASILA